MLMKSKLEMHKNTELYMAFFCIVDTARYRLRKAWVRLKQGGTIKTGQNNNVVYIF